MKFNLILVGLVAVLAKTEEDKARNEWRTGLESRVTALQSSLTEQKEQLQKSQEKEERYLQKIRQYAEYISNESAISQGLLNSLDQLPKIDHSFILHQLMDKLEASVNENAKLK